jgi:2-polyprenyl-3-methyl-5-hydroxy-6-metoxy-1,4-benzoquinol methylase
MTGQELLATRFSRFSTPANLRFFDALCRHFSGLAEDPCVGMYFEFAVTTNDRGRAVASLLGERKELRGANYLDIGCAYGGFLVAFAERGADVIGIDINPTLLGLARQNLADHLVEAPLILGDATRLGALRRLCGAVDVATCNDVIEHVDSPPALAQTIADLLAPGGLCYLEIPNAWLPAYVQSDGHFQLFGITQLDYDDAKRYWEARHPDQSYPNVLYFRLPEYERMFRDAGLSMEVLPHSLAHVTMSLIEQEISTLRSTAADAIEQVPEGVRDVVAARVARYLDEVDRAPRDDEGRFLLAYGASFWKVVVQKKGVGLNSGPNPR